MAPMLSSLDNADFLLRFLAGFAFGSIGFPASVGTKPEALACSKISSIVGGFFKA
jgi:hypothetical protein